MSKKDNVRLKELTDIDGNFKSKYPGKAGESYTLGYLEELSEWIYLHDDMNDNEKMRQLVAMEILIQDSLNANNHSTFPIKYLNSWLEKLKKRLK